MLAQITNQNASVGLPDPNSYTSLGWMICILLVILVGLRQAIGFWRDLQSSKPQHDDAQQAMQSTPAAQYVREEECATRHDNITRQISELKKDIGDLRDWRTEDVKATVSSMEETNRRIDAVRLELSKKIDEMPTLIVTQLLNSKQLWKS